MFIRGQSSPIKQYTAQRLDEGVLPRPAVSCFGGSVAGPRSPQQAWAGPGPAGCSATAVASPRCHRQTWAGPAAGCCGRPSPPSGVGGTGSGVLWPALAGPRARRAWAGGGGGGGDCGGGSGCSSYSSATATWAPDGTSPGVGGGGRAGGVGGSSAYESAVPASACASVSAGAASERPIGAIGSRSAASLILFLRPQGISKHTRNIKADPYSNSTRSDPGSEF